MKLADITPGERYIIGHPTSEWRIDRTACTVDAITTKPMIRGRMYDQHPEATRGVDGNWYRPADRWDNGRRMVVVQWPAHDENGNPCTEERVAPAAHVLHTEAEGIRRDAVKAEQIAAQRAAAEDAASRMEAVETILKARGIMSKLDYLRHPANAGRSYRPDRRHVIIKLDALEQLVDLAADVDTADALINAIGGTEA